MIFPKKIVNPLVILIPLFWLTSAILVKILGFETACKILGFISSIIGLPIALYNLYKLYNISLILDEDKIIDKALKIAGKKDQEEEEKKNEMCRANVPDTNGGTSS